MKPFRCLCVLSTLLIGNIAVAVAEAGPEIQTQTLCGWFENPTPGNAWLRDRKAEWVVGIQGAHQAEGEWPEFRDSQWIKTNSSHGYGCACITGVVNPETHEVISITSARAQSLGVCRKDRALKKPAA